jgi:hypothetical protein
VYLYTLYVVVYASYIIRTQSSRTSVYWWRCVCCRGGPGFPVFLQAVNDYTVSGVYDPASLTTDDIHVPDYEVRCLVAEVCRVCE